MAEPKGSAAATHHHHLEHPHDHDPQDSSQLAALGHRQELQRNFSFLSMLGLAFAILNSWTALASSLSLALPSGGPSAVIWGLVTAGVCNLALAASLAEFLSAYPTAGGQYHWTAMIAWKSWVPSLSWIVGWINVAGWIALTASAGLLGSQLIIGVISLYTDGGYTPQPWQQFLLYIAYNLVAFCINTFGTLLLPLMNRSAFIWSMSGFVIICIVCLATASPNYQSGDFVFRQFYNETGWPDGIAWLLGLLQGGFGLTGFDAVAHMVEELGNPSVEGPRIMIACVLIGLVSGFIFLMVLLFVSNQTIDYISSSANGPLLEIIYEATNSKAGSVCLLMFPLVCLLFAATGIMTTSSRMTYAFARDGGLPFSKQFAKVHKTLDLPLNALILTVVLVVIFGCIFLGSSAAFNAILSASVVALGLSYAIPPAVNCLRGRKMLPEERYFKMPPLLGWACNILGIVYVIITTVLFVFPPDLPVTGSNMNYCIVAFAIIIIISAVQWIIDGRKNYKGPQIDMAAMATGEVMGLAPEMSRTNEVETYDEKAPQLEKS